MKRTRLTINLLLVLTACLLAGSIAMNYWTGLLALESSRKLATQRAVIQQLEQTVSNLKDAESGHRGYLLTGENRYLEPYDNAKQKVRRELNELQRLVVRGALPEDHVEKISDLIEKKLAEMEETIRLRKEQGLEGTLPRVREGLGRQLMNEIRSEALNMESGKETEYLEAARRTEKGSTLRTGTFIGTALLNLAFLAWVGRRIWKAIDQREAAVAESERQREFLATTLGSIGDGVIVTDPIGCVTFLNAEAERLTGWRAAEARGKSLKNIFRIVSEETRLPVENPAEKALITGTTVGLESHTLLISRDGKERPIDDSGAPVRGEKGPVLGMVLVFRDISEQRKGQQAREQLAAIVESSEDAIFSNTLDGIIQTWNIGAQRMFGYTPEEIRGKPVSMLLPPDHAAEEGENLRKVKAGGRVAAMETVRLARDGQPIEVSVTVSALHNDQGALIGVSQIVRNITERKRTQRELQRMNTQLEARVADRTRSLHEATDQLNAFCYSVAHDLQAPLRAQLAFAQVLLEDFGDAIGPTGREYIQRIAQSADRQGQLVRDLLAHVSLSRTELPLEAVDLSKAVQRVRMDLIADIEGQQAEVVCGPLAGKVLANPSSLHLIITNLLSNALKFVARGSHPSVRIWSEPCKGSLRLWVEDKGIGIPERHVGKLFGVFQRLHTIDEYPGTGIGLAIVKKAAERMNGTVGVESQVGVGSRFWVELKPATVVEPRSSNQNWGGSKTEDKGATVGRMAT